MDTWSTVVSKSTDTWAEIYGRMQSREYSSRDAMDAWSSLVNLYYENTVDLLSLPFTPRDTGGVPTVLFVRDAVAEGADARNVHLQTAIDPDTPLGVTPLIPLGGGAPVDGDFVSLNLQGRTLQVGLQNLRRLPPGHYVATVYADERGSIPALAVVHVTSKN
jgi:hypothetical protein